MKFSRHLYKTTLLLILPIAFLACSKENTDTPVEPPVVVVKPQLDSLALSADSRLLTIYFSQGVFGHSKQELPPVTGSELHFNLSGGQALLDSVDVVHVAGDSVATVSLYISGVISGTEVLEVKAANDSSVMNRQRHYMTTQAKTISLNETGIFGLWVSADTNLSLLFQQFNFDSVVMEYKVDGTYTFETIKTGSIHNRLSGTYTQSKSEVNGIWMITLNQQSPVESRMEGIFSPQNGVPVKLKYETVQTMPAVQGLTPPSPEEGFGSSGLFGEENIQTFIKIGVN